MKTTVEQLDNVVDLIQKTLAVCSVSKSREVLVKSLSHTVSELDATVAHLKQVEKRRYIQVRKALTAVHNVMGSLCSGIDERELSVGEFRAGTRALVNTFVPRVKDSLIAELKLAASAEGKIETEYADPAFMQATAASEELAEAFVVVSKSNSIRIGVSTSGEALSEFKSLEKEALDALPSRISGDYKVIRSPICPVLPTAIPPKAVVFERLGLKFVSIEGIIVFRDQILLNVSKKCAEEAGLSPVAMAHSVLEMINTKRADESKFEIVSDTPNANQRNTDLLMYWMLPRQKLAGLMKILGGSKSKVITWGLPIASSKAQAERLKVKRLDKKYLELETRKQQALDQMEQEREAAKAAKEAAKLKKAADQRQADVEKKKRIQLKRDQQQAQQAQREGQLTAKLTKLVANKSSRPSNKKSR